jgi:hypothetical protein
MTERDKLIAKIKDDIDKGMQKFVERKFTKPTKEEVSEYVSKTLERYLGYCKAELPDPPEELATIGPNGNIVINVRAMAAMLYWYESNEQTRAELMFKKMYGQNALENVQSVGFSPEGDWQVKFLHPVEYFLVTLETSKDGVKIVEN